MILPISRHILGPDARLVLAGSGGVVRCGEQSLRLGPGDIVRLLDRCTTACDRATRLESLTGLASAHDNLIIKGRTIAAIRTDIVARQRFCAGRCTRGAMDIAIPILPALDVLNWPEETQTRGLFWFTARAERDRSAILDANLGPFVDTTRITLNPGRRASLANDLGHALAGTHMWPFTPTENGTILLRTGEISCLFSTAGATALADWLATD